MIRIISLYVSTIHIIHRQAHTVCVTHHVIGSQLLLYRARRITLGNYTVGGPVSLMTDGNRLHRTITHCTHAPHGHTGTRTYNTYIYKCIYVCVCVLAVRSVLRHSQI